MTKHFKKLLLVTTVMALLVSSLTACGVEVSLPQVGKSVDSEKSDEGEGISVSGLSKDKTSSNGKGQKADSKEEERDADTDRKSNKSDKSSSGYQTATGESMQEFLTVLLTSNYLVDYLDAEGKTTAQILSGATDEKIWDLYNQMVDYLQTVFDEVVDEAHENGIDFSDVGTYQYCIDIISDCDNGCNESKFLTCMMDSSQLIFTGTKPDSYDYICSDCREQLYKNPLVYLLLSGCTEEEFDELASSWVDPDFMYEDNDSSSSSITTTTSDYDVITINGERITLGVSSKSGVVDALGLEVTDNSASAYGDVSSVYVDFSDGIVDYVSVTGWFAQDEKSKCDVKFDYMGIGLGDSLADVQSVLPDIELTYESEYYKTYTYRFRDQDGFTLCSVDLNIGDGGVQAITVSKY